MSEQRERLPQGWVRARLGDLADLALGKMLDKAKRTAGTPMPYLRNINVRWHAFDLRDVYAMPFEPHEIERYSVREGDVLICEGGEPGRAAVWEGPTMMFQKAIHRVRPRDNAFVPRWLVWHLHHDAATGRLASAFTGTTIKHLTGSSLARYEVLLPPIAEQRRIVAKLDELLASSRATRAALDAVPVMLEQYRQAVLAAAFRGDLTADWRAANPALVSDRQVVPFERLVTSLRGGTAATSLRSETPWPVLRSSAVRPGRVDLCDCSFLPAHEAPGDDHLIADGEVLITRLSGSLEYVGNAAVVRGLAGRRIAYPDRLFRARLAPGVEAEYVTAAFQSRELRSPLEAAAKSSAGHQRISLSDVRRFPVPIVSLDEQRAVVRRLHARFAAIERQLALVDETRVLLAQLEQSALATAFRGELVPQDPTDEPASVLLERIRSDRSERPVRRSRHRPART